MLKTEIKLAAFMIIFSNKSVCSIASIAFVAGLSIAPAHALTVDDVNLLKDLTNKLLPNALKIGEIVEDGETITLNKLEFTTTMKDFAAADPNTDAASLEGLGLDDFMTAPINIKVDAIVFEGIARNADGSSVIQSVEMQNLDGTYMDFGLRQTNSKVSNEIRLPNIKDLTALEGKELLLALSRMQADLDRFISSNTSEDAAISYKGQDVFKIASTQFTQSEFDEDAQYYTKFDGAAEGLFLAGNVADVPEYNLAFALLELTEITGRAEIKGTWDTKSGDATMDGSLVLDGLTTIEQDLTLTGFLPEMVETFYTMDSEDPDELLAALSPLGFSNFTLKIINDGLFERGIKAAAQAQGMSTELMLVQAESGAMLGASFLAQLGPELSAQATEAVKNFFSDPKSISFTIAPDPALSFAEAIALEGQSPDVVINRLNMSIKANQ